MCQQDHAQVGMRHTSVQPSGTKVTLSQRTYAEAFSYMGHCHIRDKVFTEVLNLNEVIRVGFNPIWLMSFQEGKIWTETNIIRGKTM